MPGTRSASASSTDTTTKTKEGTIEYVDMGDWTLEIDNRLDVEQRRRLPKSQRDVIVDPKTHKELEERIKVENEVRKTEREAAEAPLEVPPLEEERDPDEPPPSVTVTAEGEEKTSSETKS